MITKKLKTRISTVVTGLLVLGTFTPQMSAQPDTKVVMPKTPEVQNFSGQTKASPPTQVPKTTAGEDCINAGVNALKAAAIVTAAGCILDLFLTGGTMCVLYVSGAVAHAPATAAVGCAVGTLGAAAGTSVGANDAVHVLQQHPF